MHNADDLDDETASSVLEFLIKVLRDPKRKYKSWIRVFKDNETVEHVLIEADLCTQ